MQSLISKLQARSSPETKASSLHRQLQAVGETSPPTTLHPSFGSGADLSGREEIEEKILLIVSKHNSSLAIYIILQTSCYVYFIYQIGILHAFKYSELGIPLLGDRRLSF